MGDRSMIEWTDATWNPVTGCTKVSQGCKHCYAEAVFPRAYSKDNVHEPPIMRPRLFTDVWTHPDRLDVPIRWRQPRRIFVNSMSDLFHEHVPEAFIDKVFLVMTQADRHTYQVLTKRPERMRAYVLDWMRRSGSRLTSNVWLGVSVEDQATAVERIPLLLKTPAAVRWISAEPLLGPVDLDDLIVPDGSPGENHMSALDCDVAVEDDGEYGGATLDWVVAGGESGLHARPMHPDWARSLRDQCVAYHVPFLFKQWGACLPLGMATDQPHNTNRSPAGAEVDGQGFVRIGKRAAGRLLDGRLWDEYPS